MEKIDIVHSLFYVVGLICFIAFLMMSGVRHRIILKGNIPVGVSESLKSLNLLTLILASTVFGILSYWGMQSTGSPASSSLLETGNTYQVYSFNRGVGNEKGALLTPKQGGWIRYFVVLSPSMDEVGEYLCIVNKNGEKVLIKKTTATTMEST